VLGDGAGSSPARFPLHGKKQQGSYGSRQAAGEERAQRMLAAEEEDDETDGVPEPAIAAASRVDHPKAHPARRAPVVEPPHDAMVAIADEFQHCLWQHHHAGISRTQSILNNKGRPSRYTVNSSKSFRSFSSMSRFNVTDITLA
jgi:hypothetical protein